MNDPRAGEAAQRFMRVWNELAAFGTPGFAVMLDTASAAEITLLLDAVRVIQSQIDRTKRLL